MSKLQNLEAVKDLLKPYLGQYLSMQGVKYTQGHNFVCIDPSHSDWDGDGGSMGLVRGNTNIMHCFGCGIRGDIFLAAHLLENKPMTGKAFGIENPEIQLSEEDLYEMQVKAAYAHAASIMTSSDLSDAVQAKLADMEWSVDTRSKLGIGSVTNFSTYMDRMVKQYGHPVKFLQSVDLANDKLFSQNNLIFTDRKSTRLNSSHLGIS